MFYLYFLLLCSQCNQAFSVTVSKSCPILGADKVHILLAMLCLYLYNAMMQGMLQHQMHRRERGSSVVRHLPLVLEVPGSIPTHDETNFGV